MITFFPDFIFVRDLIIHFSSNVQVLQYDLIPGYQSLAAEESAQTNKITKETRVLGLDQFNANDLNNGKCLISYLIYYLSSPASI